MKANLAAGEEINNDILAEILTCVRSSGLMAKDLLSIKYKTIMDSSR